MGAALQEEGPLPVLLELESARSVFVTGWLVCCHRNFSKIHKFGVWCFGIVNDYLTQNANLRKKFAIWLTKQILVFWNVSNCCPNYINFLRRILQIIDYKPCDSDKSIQPVYCIPYYLLFAGNFMTSLLHNSKVSKLTQHNCNIQNLHLLSRDQTKKQRYTLHHVKSGCCRSQ